MDISTNILFLSQHKTANSVFQSLTIMLINGGCLVSLYIYELYETSFDFLILQLIVSTDKSVHYTLNKMVSVYYYELLGGYCVYCM